MERGSEYDFGLLDPIIEAMNRQQIIAIWDLCHYGYPDGADPFAPEFAERFARYCRAATEHVTSRVHGPWFFTPINEITFWGFCGGEWGWVAPHCKTREDRFRFRFALCRAAIAGVRAIREVCPEARMVHMEPLIQVVAPKDRPDLQDEAREETHDDTFFAWDVLAGRRGSPDIVGANCYSFGQMEYREAEGRTPPWLRAMSAFVPCATCCRTPGIDITGPSSSVRRAVSVTGVRPGSRMLWRSRWQPSIGGLTSMASVYFPASTCPTGTTASGFTMGSAILIEDGGDLRRVPFEPYVQELRRWQKTLNRVTELDEDPFSDPVELQDVVDAASRLQTHADKDWS